MFSFSFAGIKKMFTRSRKEIALPKTAERHNVAPDPEPQLFTKTTPRTIGCNNPQSKKDARKRARRSRRINRHHAKYSR